VEEKRDVMNGLHGLRVPSQRRGWRRNLRSWKKSSGSWKKGPRHHRKYNKMRMKKTIDNSPN